MLNRGRQDAGEQVGSLLYPQKQGPTKVNHMQKHKQKLLLAQQDNAQKWEEAKQDKIPKEQFKMKKFQNVSSKLRNNIEEREMQDDLKPMAGDIMGNDYGDQGAQKGGFLPPIHKRSNSSSGQVHAWARQPRVSTSQQRSSQRLQNAGGGIPAGGSKARLNKGVLARNASYQGGGNDSARGPQALSKDMLASLDNYNKLQDKGRRSDSVADRIGGSAAKKNRMRSRSKKRRQEGELGMSNQKFRSSKGLMDEANTDKDKENSQLKANAQQPPRPPTKEQKQRMLPPKGPAFALQAAANDKDKDFGKVPKYLQKFKEEAKTQEFEKEEQAKLQEQLKNRPPGTTIMSEEERLQTLAELQKSKQEVNDLLKKMPIAMKSQMMERQQKELYDKLDQIDKAINTMNRKVVYLQT